MSLCPNTNGGQCRCQPQDGVMCPYGPTPNDWKPWKEAAAASARDDLHAAIMNLPCRVPADHTHLWISGYKYGHRNARHAAAELALADRAASAPQAVRMPLTEEQILRTPLDWTGDCDAKIAFAREIEAAHGIVPLAPQEENK